MTSSFPQELEDEAVYFLRETAAQFEHPALLFSGGKDSITLVHLAVKAFYPAMPPFPLVHIDTGHNFPETIAFRDDVAKKTGIKLLVGSVENTIKQQGLQEEIGYYASRNSLQTHTLLETIASLKLDACIGGARRDEEKARAKERIFSLRNSFGQWDVKNQRPEVFSILNGKINYGENMRVFPISNWTELDVWNYIYREKIEVPSLYFTHKRAVFYRDGLTWPDSAYINKKTSEKPIEKNVRFRTIGDMTCTAAQESDVFDVEGIIKEIQHTKTSERGARIDDKKSEAAMENRKNEGYF